MATIEELQARITAMQEKLDALTAPPADYYTSRYSGEEIDSGIDRALPGGAIDGSLAGKAPAGYGLGVHGPSVSDFNSARLCGWYAGGGSAVNGPDFPYSGYGVVMVVSGGSVVYQHYYMQSRQGAIVPLTMAVRQSEDEGASWTEWEYINPPLSPGVEYRTTERYLGKPVYVKLVNCGAGPAAGAAVSVAHGIPNMGYIVDFRGVLTDAGGQALGLPYYINAGNQGYLRVNYYQIQIFAVGTDLTGYKDTKVWIKYTKTTD